MPFIQIKSLPFERTFDVSEAVRGIARDFALANDIPLFHVHTTWEFFLAGHYAKGEDAPDMQPDSNYPVLVDLLTPDFNSAEVIEKMLNSLASSIARHAHMDIKNIFINHRYAHSEMVFDDGKIVKW